MSKFLDYDGLEHYNDKVQAEFSQLSLKVDPLTEPIAQTAGNDELVEFRKDSNDELLAEVSVDGVYAKDVKIADGNGGRASVGTYVDNEEDDDESLSIGSPTGKNIVEFSQGHIRTKYFDSRNIQPASVEIDNKNLRLFGFLDDFYSYNKGKYNNSWFDRLKILHFSDTHANYENLAEILGLGQYPNLFIDTGDNANAVGSTEVSTTLGELNGYSTTVGNLPYRLLVSPGNHDVINLTKKQYYDIMCATMSRTTPNFVFGDSANYRTYGYYDITPNETSGTTRVILLDPFDYNDGQFSTYGAMCCVFSQTQITWLINALRAAATNGYSVITVMHYSFGDNPNFVDTGSANPDAYFKQDPFMIPDIIDAMQNKTTLSKSYPDSTGLNNVTINENFSGINDFHYICHLFGHIHSENDYQCQKTDGSKQYDMLMLGAPNAGSEGFAINKVPLQIGTINSIKATLLAIDTKEQAVYRINYGAYKAYDGSVTERTERIPYRFND